MVAVEMAKSESLTFSKSGPLPITSWFSARGSVVRRGSISEVFMGGTLIGVFEDGEQFERNAILVQLSEDPRCHLGRLAEAFASPLTIAASSTSTNHMRPYTGKHVIRRGWRMQDKRVRPGVSDYYVHEADGRPLFRIDVPRTTPFRSG
jgi:hypothetical protein